MFFFFFFNFINIIKLFILIRLMFIFISDFFFIILNVDMAFKKCQIKFIIIILLVTSAFIIQTVHFVCNVGLVF